MRKRTKVLIGVAAGLGALVLGGFVYIQLMKKGYVKYNEYDRRVEGRLRVGDTAPDLELAMYDGTPVRLSSLWADGKPLFLVFGSCTWPPFRKKIGDLHAIYDANKDRANFLTVYIAEAHPDDEWQVESNRQDKVVLKQPRHFAERKEAARILVDRLKYRVPVAIDAMDNRADEAFAAWPERIYIVGQGGRILYKGGMGPFGFQPQEASQKLSELLSRPVQANAGG